MATYVIGDVQGCFEPLQRLLDRMRFDPAADRLWLVGDLVNRGPRSLDVLRWARALGPAVTAVLGNHELHLLACAAGIRRLKGKDTLSDVLDAPDRDALVDWVAGWPFLHREGRYVLVHGGLHPAWTAEEAEALAAEAAAALRHDRHGFLATIQQPPQPPAWSPTLSGPERLRVIATALTGLRTCRRDGRMCVEFKGPPSEAPRGCQPWFEIEGRRSLDVVVHFGHWAALGLVETPTAIGLDTGCVWGQALTARRLEDGRVFQVPARP